ncbi:MAG: hypothetical protein ABW019_06725 [Chitinophagaceae bacterium]
MSIKENSKYLAKQAVYAMFAFMLVIVPFFIDKWNMSVHYVFSFLAFTLLLRNLLTSKRKLLPVLLMLIGLFFIIGYLIGAQKGKAGDRAMYELRAR